MTRYTGTVVGLVAALLLASSLLVSAPAGAALEAPERLAADQDVVSVEWLGWMFFRITSPRGVVVLTSPWFENPDIPFSLDQLGRADIVLVPNSHPDDMGNPIEVAAQTGATVLAPLPLGRWLVENGLDQRLLVRAGLSDDRIVRGIRIRVLQNLHDNTMATGADGGPAVAYMITFENGFTVYYSPHNMIQMDMQLYGMLYKPDMALLSLASPESRNSPGPLEFAHIVRFLSTENPNLRIVIPTHIRPGAPVVDEAKAEMERLGLRELMFEPVIGEVYRF